MKKNKIILVLISLLLTGSECKYSPVRDRMRLIRELSRGIVHLNRNEINTNLIEAADDVDELIEDSINNINK